MALGAVPADVRAMILLQGLKLAGAGVVLGTASALVLTRVMVSLVFGVKTYDPAVFVGVALLLSAIALIAALVPAHRATRVNPLDAVRGFSSRSAVRCRPSGPQVRSSRKPRNPDRDRTAATARR